MRITSAAGHKSLLYSLKYHNLCSVGIYEKKQPCKPNKF